MIELRWLVEFDGLTTLQYRQMVNDQWTEWKNVPYESDRDPSCP